MKRSVIAVDGLAGSGKSTLAQMLAERLGFIHLNTGLLYRATGYLALRHGVSRTDSKALVELMRKHSISLELDASRRVRVLVDGVSVEDQLTSPEASEAASLVASQLPVREELRGAQRDAFPGEGLVAEGRDMGTVIFPDANVKFYIEVDYATRAKRRLSQLEQKGLVGPGDDPAELQSRLAREIEERDRRDTERLHAPTKPASDAITIDNSARSLTEVVQSMYDTALNQGLIRSTR